MRSEQHPPPRPRRRMGMALALTNVAVAELQPRQALVRRVELARRSRGEHEGRRQDGLSGLASISSASIALARGNVREAARLVGAASDCTKSSASIRGEGSKSSSSSAPLTRFARRSAWMRPRKRSSTAASSRSRRRPPARSPRPATRTERFSDHASFRHLGQQGNDHVRRQDRHELRYSPAGQSPPARRRTRACTAKAPSTRTPTTPSAR